MAADRILDTPNLAIKECKYGTFLYNQHDLFISRALDLYGEWCESEIETLKPYIQDGAVVLDVGANIGTHAVAFAKLAGQNGHVLAFEPQRLIYYMLCANAALNSLTNLQCFKLAVSDAPGKARIPFRRLDTEFNFGCIALEEGNGKVGPSESVDCITVDSLKLTRCDVIKVDVEGYEDKVLRGCAQTLKLNPVLFIENNRAELSAQLVGDLLHVGYVPFWHIAPYFSERNHFGNKDNVFKNYVPEANVLCLRKDDPRVRDVGLPRVKGPEETWEQAWRGMKAAV